MRNLIFILLFGITMTACAKDDVQAQNNDNMKTNIEKVVDLLKSIETGAAEPIAYINANHYVQHNQNVADGLAGFGAVLQQLPEGSAKANTVRVWEDGDYVIAHTEYNFFGPKIGIDIFRFEEGLIVEHWDNLQEIATETVSGRTQTDGTTAITDLDQTEANKALVSNLINDIFLGANPDKITDYISTEQYDQHNPGVGDGLAGLGEALAALAEAGMPMVYEQNHIILGQGNFVLSVSEGIFMNEKVAFYDIFRVEEGKVVEHWDTIENIIPEEEAQNTNGKLNF